MLYKRQIAQSWNWIQLLISAPDTLHLQPSFAFQKLDFSISLCILTVSNIRTSTITRDICVFSSKTTHQILLIPLKAMTTAVPTLKKQYKSLTSILVLKNIPKNGSKCDWDTQLLISAEVYKDQSDLNRTKFIAKPENLLLHHSVETYETSCYDLAGFIESCVTTNRLLKHLHIRIITLSLRFMTIT